MHILITHFYDRHNGGDAAILSVTISELQAAFPEAEFTIQTMEDVKKYPDFEGHPTVTSFIPIIFFNQHSFVVKMLHFGVLLITTFMWAILNRFLGIKADFLLTADVRKIMHALQQADLVVPVGGGYLRSKESLISTVNLILLLYPLYLAKILNKPVMLFSQSLGPFSNGFENALVTFVLNKVDLILVREHKTKTKLEKMGVNPKLMISSADAGFIFDITPAKQRLPKGLLPRTQRKLVGLTARKWLAPKEQAQFETEVANFIRWLVNDLKHEVVFIPQVTSSMFEDDDFLVMKRIQKKIRKVKHVTYLYDQYTHHELKALYTHLDYMVGTRFHSVIFALTSLVPAMAIEYEHKTSGILTDLNLEKWYIKMEDVTTEKLQTMFRDLQKQEKRYRATLRKNLPVYQQLASRAKNRIKKTYKQFQTLPPSKNLTTEQ